MKDHEREKLRARAFATGRTIRGGLPEQAPPPSMDVLLPPRPPRTPALPHPHPSEMTDPGGHVFARTCGRNDPDCRCGICDGGIAYCEICKEGEADLADVCPGSRGNPGHGSSTTEAPMPADPKPAPAEAPPGGPSTETKDDGFKVTVAGWWTLTAQMENVPGGAKYEKVEVGMKFEAEAPSAPGQAAKLGDAVRASLRKAVPESVRDAQRAMLNKLPL